MSSKNTWGMSKMSVILVWASSSIQVSNMWVIISAFVPLPKYMPSRSMVVFDHATQKYQRSVLFQNNSAFRVRVELDIMNKEIALARRVYVSAIGTKLSRHRKGRWNCIDLPIIMFYCAKTNLSMFKSLWATWNPWLHLDLNEGDLDVKKRLYWKKPDLSQKIA
jgi:hypothetical protein